MPLYEYQCESCHRVTERIQKFSDPPMETCPACGGPVKKLPSSPAIQFKGSGWYVTDYARKSSNASGKESSKADSSEKSAKKDAGAADSGAKADSTPSKTDS